MSRLGEQIRRYMSDLGGSGDGELTARFSFPAEFLGFQGHFPVRSVLPAVCELQAAVTMLEAWTGRGVRLKEVVVAKFTAPVSCDEELVYSCSLASEDGSTVLLKTNVTRGGESVARFKLRVVLEAERQGC